MLTIHPRANLAVYEFPLVGAFTVDLHQSMRNQIGPVENLTRETAIRALKWIQLESNIRAFFVKPVRLLITGTIILIATTMSVVARLAGKVSQLSLAHFVLFVFGTVVVSVSGYLMGCALKNKEALEELSAAWTRQAARAKEYIQGLEAHPELNIRLAPMNELVEG